MQNLHGYGDPQNELIQEVFLFLEVAITQCMYKHGGLDSTVVGAK